MMSTYFFLQNSLHPIQHYFIRLYTSLVRLSFKTFKHINLHTHMAIFKYPKNCFLLVNEGVCWQDPEMDTAAELFRMFHPLSNQTWSIVEQELKGMGVNEDELQALR